MAQHYGHAGKSAREMAEKRYLKFYVYAGSLLAAAILLFLNLNHISRLGLPAVILVVVLVRIGGDLVEKKGLYVKKRAKDAERGAKAEEVVAEQLSDLPEGYYDFHDVPFTGFNIDHVVIGPGGIFMVETKSHAGKVSAEGDRLLLNGKPPQKNFLNQTWRQAYEMRDFLYLQTSMEWKVNPILCFTRAFVTVRRPVKGVEVVRAGYLGKHIARQRATLSQEQIEKLVRVMEYRTTRLEAGKED
jgi:hypothetical protein